MLAEDCNRARPARVVFWNDLTKEVTVPQEFLACEAAQTIVPQAFRDEGPLIGTHRPHARQAVETVLAPIYDPKETNIVSGCCNAPAVVARGSVRSAPSDLGVLKTEIFENALPKSTRTRGLAASWFEAPDRDHIADFERHEILAYFERPVVRLARLGN